MSKRTLFFLVVFCVAQIINYVSAEDDTTVASTIVTHGATGGSSGAIDTSTAAQISTTSVMPTSSSSSDTIKNWDINCTDALCSYKLHAPANDPSALGNISAILNKDNETLVAYQQEYEKVKVDASTYAVTLNNSISQLEELRDNLSLALNFTANKLKQAISDLNALQEIANNSQCILAEAAVSIPCYAQCNVSCLPATTFAPTTMASTSIGISSTIGYTGSTPAITFTGSTASIGSSISGAMSSAPTVTGTYSSSAVTAAGTIQSSQAAMSSEAVSNSIPTMTTTTPSPTTVINTEAAISTTTTPTTTPSPTTVINTEAATSTTTTPTTTTPTVPSTPPPRPTPPNPCGSKNCNGTLGYPGTCSSNSQGQGPATCECPGNLDPDNCDQVGCISIGEGGLTVTKVGPFWSPDNRNGTNPYGAPRECQWIMRSPIGGQTVYVKAIYFKTIQNDGSLEIRSSTGATLTLTGDYSTYMDALNQRLNATVLGADTVTFTFTSSTAGAIDDYFNLEFNFVDASP